MMVDKFVILSNVFLQNMQGILTASPESMAILDVSTRMLSSNEAFNKLIGQEAEELIGQTFYSLLDKNKEQSRRCGDALLLSLQQGQALKSTECEIVVGKTRQLLRVSLTPLVNEENSYGLLIAQPEIIARESMQSRPSFLSLLAHELRSPLNTINGYLELLLAEVGGELTLQQHEFVQRARSGSEQLYAMLENLLIIARADTAQLRLQREILHLTEVIDTAVEELELTALDSNITISVQVDKNVPRLYADRVRIQQVLRNLLSNALRFTPMGGRIIVSASVEEVKKRTSEEEFLVRVSVRDTGVGIASEFQQQIFERFYQIPDKSSGRGGGQGLGLAVVKMLVELHGGEVVVESFPEKGSTFSCILPALSS